MFLLWLWKYEKKKFFLIVAGWIRYCDGVDNTLRLLFWFLWFMTIVIYKIKFIVIDGIYMTLFFFNSSKYLPCHTWEVHVSSTYVFAEWHKENFIQINFSFHSSCPVSVPRLKCTVWHTIYWDGFEELMSPDRFPTTITVAPWYNCYRRRKWTRRHEFKSWTWLIAFHIALIPFGKVWIQLFSFQLWVNRRTD